MEKLLPVQRDTKRIRSKAGRKAKKSFAHTHTRFSADRYCGGVEFKGLGKIYMLKAMLTKSEHKASL